MNKSNRTSTGSSWGRTSAAPQTSRKVLHLHHRDMTDGPWHAPLKACMSLEPLTAVLVADRRDVSGTAGGLLESAKAAKWQDRLGAARQTLLRMTRREEEKVKQKSAYRQTRDV